MEDNLISCIIGAKSLQLKIFCILLAMLETLLITKEREENETRYDNTYLLSIIFPIAFCESISTKRSLVFQ